MKHDQFNKTLIMASKATGTYRRILNLLRDWPIDESKVGRDLGTFLKNSIRELQKSGKLEENQQYWDRQYLSLQKIINSEHQKKYPRILSSSATGLTAEQCKLVLSSEFWNNLKRKSNHCLRNCFHLKRYIKMNHLKLVMKRLYSTYILEGSVAPRSHVPVLLDDVLEYLKPSMNQIILDMTFGAGGHSQKILESGHNIKLLALDRDPLAYSYMERLTKIYPGQITSLLGKFSELPLLLSEKGIEPNSLDGILFDFGCSSMQFDQADRGFSLSNDGPLDMRMDGNRFPELPSAANVLAKVSEEDLVKILKVYGEEKQAKKIARAIVESRYLFRNLNTTGELADLVDSVCNEQIRVDKLQRRAHNATKTFQALRIFVNNELNEINYGLILARKYLKIGGRIVTISFHSLEDTIVKRHFMGNLIENIPNELPLKYLSYTTSASKRVLEKVMESNWKCLHKHVILPTEAEVENNPRSRSAKLRAAIKVK